MSGNFTILQNEDITSDLSNGAFRLYVLLQSYCYNNKNTCYPSQATLGKLLNRSIRSVQRYLKELESKRYITWKRRGSISNIYTMMKKIIRQKVNKAVNNVKNAYNKYKNKIDEFNNYKQREYDYNQLEKQLTSWQLE